ncbi:uncharacterized protein LOC125804043 [Astyanax mexicanus]|uniref:uncharacterized protein LOC125804043 n=1 Tax=Astyanax mexicanus TaxID=7994 RepID=UPI0020CAB101|nr:uncharacterized protein LOC125804043 [Astyanax mexicanus]
MDWRWTFSVHPPEAESGAPEASPPRTPPLSVDSAMDLSSDDCSVLSAGLLSLGQVPPSWVKLKARIQEVDLISDDTSLQSLGEVPRSRVECIEASLLTSHPEPSPPSPSPARHRIPHLQVVSDPEISPQNFDVLLPFCCQEAPVADLPTPTTTYLETSQQDDTGLPSPTNNTWGRFRKCLANIFSSMSSCFRSRDRVVVLIGEADKLHWLDIDIPKPDSEPVPAAKRGWLLRVLRRFRRASRRG